MIARLLLESNRTVDDEIYGQPLYVHGLDIPGVGVMIRWPGRIPAGQVSNEIVHNTDVFTTLAHAVGATVPTDRAIDGVNQLPFFEGKQKSSANQSLASERRRTTPAASRRRSRARR